MHLGARGAAIGAARGYLTGAARGAARGVGGGEEAGVASSAAAEAARREGACACDQGAGSRRRRRAPREAGLRRGLDGSCGGFSTGLWGVRSGFGAGLRRWWPARNGQLSLIACSVGRHLCSPARARIAHHGSMLLQVQRYVFSTAACAQRAQQRGRATRAAARRSGGDWHGRVQRARKGRGRGGRAPRLLGKPSRRSPPRR